MLNSLDVLQSTTFARANSAPLVPPPTPLGGANILLEGFRQRNAFLDWLFYDVQVVSDNEARDIAPWLAAEGAILIVPPTGDRIRLCSSIDEFKQRTEKEVRTLVVAGVGSSAFGAAAFARNVADALDESVATVVSGYGLADLASEAMGGWFWFGYVNHLRHEFEWLDRLRESGIISDPAFNRGVPKALVTVLRESKDTRTVREMMLDEGLSFNLLVGHSKGNLVISEALFGLEPGRLRALGQSTCIVTISAKTRMPDEFSHVVHVMGNIDGFGAMNSRWFIKTDESVERAWHHTNTELPFHLDVEHTMSKLKQAGKLNVSAAVRVVGSNNRSGVTSSGGARIRA